MSFGIAILLTEQKLLSNDYHLFLNECAQIGGQWHIHEHRPFASNSDEIVHDCVLIDPVGRPTKEEKGLSVWITLSKEEGTKRYGRCRRKINWMIYVETKAGRSPWSLAVQMTIPLKAFAIFRGIVVVVDPERVFLEANNYRIFATRELAANLGEEAIREFGLLDVDGQLKSATTPDGV